MICVGVDASKGSSTVSILDTRKSMVPGKPYAVKHNKEELCVLADKLSEMSDDVRVVVEATSHYHMPLALTLLEKGVYVSCVNALRTNNYAKDDLRRAKTDNLDAQKMAKFCLSKWDELESMHKPEALRGELRLLSRQYDQHMRSAVRERVNLSNLIDQVMPEIQTVISPNGDEGKKLFTIVERYWHYNNIQKMGQEAFCKDFCVWAKEQGYLNNERKSKELFELSQKATLTLPCVFSTELVVKAAAQAVIAAYKLCNTIMAQMQKISQALPEYCTVSEMGGIGVKLAPRLIAEIGDIRRFHCRNALISYAGIDSPPYQSGQIDTHHSITKRGNKYLRHIGFQAMQSVKRVKPRTDNAVYNQSIKKEKEGKHKTAAKIAGLTKFLRIYYARVSDVYAA